MDIFNKIGSKITEAGQGIQEQTKQLTESTRINNTLTSNQKTISNLYTDLGMLYFQSLNGQPADLGADIFNNINALTAENEQLKETLAIVKGIVYCPNCNAESLNTANCCSSCGTVLIKVPCCFNCGVEVDLNARFCTSCGANTQQPVQ